MKNTHFLKKGVAVCLAVLLMISLIACSSGNSASSSGGQGGSTASKDGGQTGTPSSEPMMLQLWTSNKDVPNNPGAFYLKKIEDTFNVKFDIQVRGIGADDYNEWLNLQMLSGNSPDWIRDQVIGIKVYSDFVDQGLLAEIDPDVVRANMPGYINWVTKYSDIFGENPFSMYAIDGKAYSIPDAKVDLTKFCLMAFRKDWMENVGVTKTPETLDEVLELYKKFTFNDPDKNGVDDTYGYIGITNTPTWSFSPFFGAFGVYPGMFYAKEDGTVTRGEIEPGTKDALIFLNKMYNEGVIDPEWVTDGFEQTIKKVASSRVGSSWQNWLCILTPGGYDVAKETVPEASYVYSTGPKGPNGEQGIMNFGPLAGVGLMFAKHMETEPDRLAKYMQVFDFINNDPDFIEAEFWGQKDVTFTLDEKGDRQFLPGYETEEAQFQFGIGAGYRFPSLETFCYDPDLHDQFTFSKDMLATRQDTLKVIKGKYDILGPYPKPVWSEKAAILNPEVDLALTEFITGARPIDQFDAYVENWMANGGREVLEEAQALYDKYLK